MNRPKVSVFIAASLDGHIAAADGSLDFLACVAMPGEDYGYAAFHDSIDAVVMGRNTYDTVAGFAHWPFAGKRVVVLTHRPLAAQHGESAHAGTLYPLLIGLAAEGIRHVYLDGGQTIRQGLDEGIVDEMTISTIPVVLGAGRPLFTGHLPASTWDLAGTRHFASGLVQCTWRARELPPA